LLIISSRNYFIVINPVKGKNIIFNVIKPKFRFKIVVCSYDLVSLYSSIATISTKNGMIITLHNASESGLAELRIDYPKFVQTELSL